MTKLKKKIKAGKKKSLKNVPAPKDHNNPPEAVEEAETKTKVKEDKSKGRDSGGIAGKQLLQFIDRVERLEEEKKALSDDIKDLYSHAKATGFDVKIMRKVVAIRKKDSQSFEEEQELIDTYRHAIEDI